ncbi:MAG TPA: protease complex subunit PrcB family protein [Burkholderiaceae bacterium]
MHCTQYARLAASLLAALAGCGGAPSNAQPPRLLAQSVGHTYDASAQHGVDLAGFVRAARASTCSDRSNRLYLIDRRHVYWDRAGTCIDDGYARTLYGATVQQDLCTQRDSQVGRIRKCRDEQARALFETIVSHRQQADLGLGAGHTVEPIALVPPSLGAGYVTLQQAGSSAVRSMQNVVIRDADTWNQVWAQHRGDVPGPAPLIDFQSSMVVGVFAGAQPAGGCLASAIERVSEHGGRLLVEYKLGPASPRCHAPVSAQPSAPVHLVAVARSDAPVQFVRLAPDAPAAPAAAVSEQPSLRPVTLERSLRSGTTYERTVVIRDAGAWAELWAAHRGAGAQAQPPAIDFSRDMVLAVFLGTRPNGCYAATIENVSRRAGATKVTYATFEPANSAVCAREKTSPAHLVVAPRTDELVYFSRA